MSMYTGTYTYTWTAENKDWTKGSSKCLEIFEISDFASFWRWRENKIRKLYTRKVGPKGEEKYRIEKNLSKKRTRE